jgi:hypothetical protein
MNRPGFQDGLTGRSLKPYRVIDRVVGNQVAIHLIVDGRRAMQLVLSSRLLGA